MKQAVEKLMAGMDEMMNEMMEMLPPVYNMEDKEFRMIKLSMKMFNEAKEVTLKQAEIIDEQNRKLDKILSLLEAKKSI